MKKILSLFLLCVISFLSLQAFASDDYEQFRTKDGRHICSVFMKNEYKLCSEFGIIYEGDRVTTGSTPFFTAGSTKNVLAVVGSEKFCVANGVEVDAAKCTEKSTQSLEHFKTKDGRHMCSIFMKNEYSPCSNFEVIYEGDKVVSGVEPFFSAGFPSIELIKIGSETFCVEGSPSTGGLEVDISKCQNVIVNENTTTQKNMPSIENGSQDATLVTSSQAGEFEPKCELNGKRIDCAEMTAGLKTAAKTGFGIFAGVAIVSLIGFVFWLVMLIHALSNPIPNKVLWVILLLFFGIVGAIIYYFAIKRGYGKAPKPQMIEADPNMRQG